MRKYIIALLAFVVAFSFAMPALADDDVIDEKYGLPIVVYGDTLSDAQKEEVRKLLDVTDSSKVQEYNVTGADIANYIDGDPHSNMYSSAKIMRQDDSKGLTINIVTPDNITQVTSDMYANALLTAGVEGAVVEVASPVKVTGHSALTGIYKAYDADGDMLDKDRMEVANEELDVATDLAEKDGLDQEKVTELLAEIKKAIADQDPATKEDVERIVKEQLDKLEITLSDEDRQMLTNLFDKMRDLDIDFDKVKNQLEDIASSLKDKAGELGLDEGFWEKVVNFFKNIFNKLSNMFD
ncbi:MAG TPA: DUF1002 domain-containing protein [Bacillota bacterium]|nr:DUF1002 domain-containing protein [Bacillota bacterium]